MLDVILLEGGWRCEQQFLVRSWVAVGCTACLFNGGGLFGGRGRYSIIYHGLLPRIDRCMKGPCIFDTDVPSLTLDLVMFLPKRPRYSCQLEPELMCSHTWTAHVLFSAKKSSHQRFSTCINTCCYKRNYVAVASFAMSKFRSGLKGAP